MIDLRKLAAIDIAFLGYRLIVSEYAFGVLFSTALGFFVLIRAQAEWQVLLGIYLACLGINYAPMLAWSLAIGKRANALAEVSEELAEKPTAMARNRKASLVLLLPLAAVVLATMRQIHKTLYDPGGKFLVTLPQK